jgi:hypothetical protein
VLLKKEARQAILSYTMTLATTIIGLDGRFLLAQDLVHPTWLMQPAT